MTERQLQLRVGMLVLCALATGVGLTLQFSNLSRLWRETYPLAIHFDEAPGLQRGSPVKQNGMTIGEVRHLQFDEQLGGVLVIVEVDRAMPLRIDSRPYLRRSLFGDARIEFSAGNDPREMPPRAKLEGITAGDPMDVVQKLEQHVSETLVAFEATSAEWRLVAKNINGLMDTNRGHLDEVVERAAVALDTFNGTMTKASHTFENAGKALEVASTTLTNANQLISDPELQGNLRKTAAELPRLAEETRMTIAAARITIQEVGRNLDTIQLATAPLAGESQEIVHRLSGSLIQLEGLLTELHRFSKIVNSENGSLQKMAGDPELYQNLNRSAQSLNVLMNNLQPIVRDVRIFSDRIARHPELLGVSGAVRGSSGLKEADEVQQSGYSVPAPLPMR